eukprot:CAMPEP_0203754332 /NCGR_PEP_ID=MMETSP0098-20131031/7941_1 /ASSEMBLY_ACC=CAM_ASM_000208 /TAXON_ID=96639 /ORGANISM=" , Strain NY0313808BC1" /LENGTH=238 /DNA_ID=CAMNT_0050645279 /DNA_START=195 /DNA_END=908 /DNA_ORIENTATION=-
MTELAAETNVENWATGHNTMENEDKRDSNVSKMSASWGKSLRANQFVSKKKTGTGERTLDRNASKSTRLRVNMTEAYPCDSEQVNKVFDEKKARAGFINTLESLRCIVHTMQKSVADDSCIISKSEEENSTDILGASERALALISGNTTNTDSLTNTEIKFLQEENKKLRDELLRYNATISKLETELYEDRIKLAEAQDQLLLKSQLAAEAHEEQKCPSIGVLGIFAGFFAVVVSLFV